MYINDLPKCVKNAKVSMYADDTALYYSSADIDVIVQKLNEDLENVRIWLMKNKLSLNVKKTEFMVLGTSRKLAHIDNDDLSFRPQNQQ